MAASFHPFVESADAVELLHAAHERIRHLIGELRRAFAGGAQREAFTYARRVCRELEIHSTVEEEIFYPEMRRLSGDPLSVNAARDEHESIRALAIEMQACLVPGAPRSGLVEELSESLMRHMQEEEEQMFSRARAAELDMYEIGARIRARELDLRLESHTGEAWRPHGVGASNLRHWHRAG